METQEIASANPDLRESLVPLMERLWRYGIVLSRQRDVAEDLVQSTCLRAIEKADQYQPGTRLDRWLFTILHSIWIDEVRSRRIRMGRGIVEASTALLLDGLHDVETRTEANIILRRVDALPEAQRTVVFLIYVEGFSYRETANLLKIPIGTVMSRLASARAKLIVEVNQQIPKGGANVG